MSKGLTWRLQLLFSLFLLYQCPVFADTAQAAIALNQGRADEAARMLETRLSEDPHDAQAHQLLCRVYYSEENADAAIRECEAAVADAPKSSDNSLWLGRAYGLKASQANPVAAFKLAKKVVAAFTEAVALDPANVSALSDLGEFYVMAPGIVGGGVDKAQQLAARMMHVSPAKAHRLLAMIAEKNGDNNAAEAEFKRAGESPVTAEAYVDLAAFYERHKEIDPCLAAVKIAVRLDRNADASLVDAASILTSANRSPQLTEQLLRQYLASAAKSDSAPAARVHVQLGDLLLKYNDRAGARREYEFALALASNYAPARKALQAL